MILNDKPNLPSKRIVIQPLAMASKYVIHECCGLVVPIAAANTKILSDLTDKLLQYLWDNENTIGIENNLIVQEALQLVQGLKSGYGTTIGYNTPDTLAYQLMEYNLFEFTASKTEARMAASTELLIDKEKKQIRSFADFHKLAIEKVGKLDKNHLESEYNLSIAVGQNSAAYHRFMAEKDTFPYVEYQTAGDNKVRNQHQLLEGKIFNLNDKEALKLWPPNGYGCRCEMIQTNKKPKNVTTAQEGQELMQKADPKWKDSQFDINRGDLKQVFTKKQFYSDIKGLPEKLNEMTFESLGLPSWNSFKSDLNPINLDKTITGDNVKELFKKEKDLDFMGFKDYFNRKMILTEDNFNKHTTGKYLQPTENRHQLFANLKDVLNAPDEVWYFESNSDIQKFQSKYLKFYKDMVLIIDCDMTSKGLEIKTWYKMKAKESTIRKGLLIKKGKDL